MEAAGRDDGGDGSDGSDEEAPEAHAWATAVTLSGDGSSIGAARDLAVEFLTRTRAEHDVAVSARAVDLTQLVVSELVTNACKYAPGPVRMELRVSDGTVAVTVQDSARAGPVARSVDPRRIGQHGLEIVMAVAQRFQVCPLPTGKRVTAHICLDDGPAAGVQCAGPAPDAR